MLGLSTQFSFLLVGLLKYKTAWAIHLSRSDWFFGRIAKSDSFKISCFLCILWSCEDMKVTYKLYSAVFSSRPRFEALIIAERVTHNK